MLSYFAHKKKIRDGRLVRKVYKILQTIHKQKQLTTVREEIVKHTEKILKVDDNLRVFKRKGQSDAKDA